MAGICCRWPAEPFDTKTVRYCGSDRLQALWWLGVFVASQRAGGWLPCYGCRLAPRVRSGCSEPGHQLCHAPSPFHSRRAERRSQVEGSSGAPFRPVAVGRRLQTEPAGRRGICGGAQQQKAASPGRPLPANSTALCHPQSGRENPLTPLISLISIANQTVDVCIRFLSNSLAMNVNLPRHIWNHPPCEYRQA
jgi:hypothetical protein